MFTQSFMVFKQTYSPRSLKKSLSMFSLIQGLVKCFRLNFLHRIDVMTPTVCELKARERINKYRLQVTKMILCKAGVGVEPGV